MSQITVGIHPKLNRLFASKDEKKRMNALTERGWQRADMSLDQLAAHLDTGASAAAWYADGHRCTDSARAQFVALDMDKGNPDRQRIADILDALNCAYISGETGSSKPDDRRYRFIIPLAGQVADADQYRQLVERLIFCFPRDIEIDANSLKIGQPWFGHKLGTTHVKHGDFLTLAAIMALPAPPEPEKPVLQRRELPTVAIGVTVNWDQERSLWTAQEVMTALDRVAPVQAGRGKYQYRHCPNPAHPDKTPSFRVSYDKSADGIGVCSCGSHSMKNIAEWVNARDFLTWFEDERRALYPAARRHKPAATAGAGQQGRADQSAAEPPPMQQADGAARFFADGLPDSWREALLKIDGAAALTYEIITEGLRAGRINPDRLTIADALETVIALGWGVSDATIRRGFKTLERVFFADLPTDLNTESTVGKFENNSTSGRKATIWRLIPLSEARPRLLYGVAPRLVENAYPAEDSPEQPAVLAPLSARALADAGIADADAASELAQLDQQLPTDERAKWTGKRVERQYRQLADRLNDQRSTPLALAGEDWKPRNASIYRESYLRALKVADPNAHRSTRQIADVLGLKSRKTAAAVVRRAGLAVHGDQFETRPITHAANVEQQVNKIARFEVQGKPRYIEVQTAEAVTELPYSAAELTRQIERGVSVSVKFQVANRHEVIADAKPIERQRRAQPRLDLPGDDPGATVETIASEPPRVRLTGPRGEDSEPTLGYSQTWVRGQIALRLKRMKWTHDGMYINRETGEVAPMDAPVHVLLGLLLGRDFAPADSSAALIAFAIEEWGAIPRSLMG